MWIIISIGVEIIAMKIRYLLLIIIYSILVYGCNNVTQEGNSNIGINMEFRTVEQTSRAIGTLGNVVMFEAWITDVGVDIVTSGIHKDTPTASSTSGESLQVLVRNNAMRQFVIKIEFDTERVFMGFLQIYVSEYTQSVEITMYETPTSSNINSFKELDEYIQNNF